MGQIRAQITSRSGPAGTKDATPIVHGDWPIYSRYVGRELTRQLADVLEAARHVAVDGMVTDISILIYDAALVPSAN